MRSRCFDPNQPKYQDYGGRGITVCDRWRDSFENFLADMGERPEGTTLERDRVNGNYEPGNCRWATAEEQSMNKRTTVRITFRGKSATLKEWAAELGVCYNTLRGRFSNGWDVERALTQPFRSGRIL